MVTELVRHGASAGQSSHVVCLRQAGQLAAELAQGQFTVLQRQSRFSMLAPVALARLLKRLRPDVVHLHSGVWYKGAFAARLARISPVVFTDHGRPHPDPLTHRSLDRLGALMTDHVVAVSDPLADYLASRLRVPRAKLGVIRNGIRIGPIPEHWQALAVRQELGVPTEALVVGAVGRFDPVKAYDRLIMAFAQLHHDRLPGDAPLALLLVGDGPEREALQRLANSLDLGDSVRFLGWRHDAQRLLCALDLFVLSSDSEGTSLSLLEAMAAGTPVIATAVGGTPDVVGPGAADQLVPPGETSALARAIGGLLHNPERRREAARRGRSRVEQEYSFEAMAAAYQALYARLLRPC